MIYRPLLIETCQYKYKFGNEEKSFTIKKKLDYYPEQRHRTASRTYHQSQQKERQSTMEHKLDCSETQKYIEFNIKEKTPNQYQRNVRRLIGQDQKLMRKQNRSKERDFELLKQHQSSHQNQMKRKVLHMIEQEPLFRKVESPKMSPKLISNNSIDSPEKQIQDKIQNYLSRKSVHLQRLSQRMDDINVSKRSMLYTSSAERDIKISSNFFKEFVGMPKEFKNKDDPELLRESYKYWAKAVKSKKNEPQTKKKVGAVFSVSVRMMLEKMRQLILDCVKKLRYMKLEPEQLLNNRTILKKPYQREGSYVFFKGVGKNDIDLVKLMLTKCRYYAFDVNENFQTALHICARKGHLEIAQLLFEYGTYPDAKDVSNRTPLYYALINEQKQLVQLLLSHKCNPWSSQGCQYSNNDTILTKMLKVARRLDMLLMMTPYSSRQYLWVSYCRVFYEF